VRRSQLLARLDAVSDRVPVIVLAAPAGYGKTTALRQWVTTGRRPVGWASLNPSDDDPVRLAGRLARALHELPMPAATADRLPGYRPPGPATAPACYCRPCASCTVRPAGPRQRAGRPVPGVGRAAAGGVRRADPHGCR
jgi:hypothetical protein